MRLHLRTKFARSLRLSAILIVLSIMLPGVVMAMGPKFLGPTKITCDTYSGTITGMFVYWRVAGQTAWSDTNRAAAGRVDQTPYDLAKSITVSGDYEICLTAYDAAGNESEASNIVPFVYRVPGAPGGGRLVQ